MDNPFEYNTCEGFWSVAVTRLSVYTGVTFAHLLLLSVSYMCMSNIIVV